jgi:hypothetical protein
MYNRWKSASVVPVFVSNIASAEAAMHYEELVSDDKKDAVTNGS